MARIKYSALVSDMRNKLNGSVLSKNRAGSYVRNKTTPVNPQTSFQQAQRQRLGSLSTGWGGLTQAQRQSWLSATSSFPYTDIFGDKKELDGKSLYIKLNSNLENVGSAQIDVAPASVGIPVFGVTGALVTPGGISADSFTVDVSSATVPAGFALAVYATPPIKPGVSFVKNKYRFIGVATVTAGVADITDAYNARGFGEFPAGYGAYVRAVLVSTTSGQMGVPTGVQAEVA
jgi:hypothetical protein